MVKIDRFRVKIIVDKEPGLYSFETLASTGKSYLCLLCERYRHLGAPVAGYDWYDYREGREIPSDVELLVIDRYDLFQSAETNAKLRKIAEKAVVLVDCKR